MSRVSPDTLTDRNTIFRLFNLIDDYFRERDE
jgi:hypothetical protein